MLFRTMNIILGTVLRSAGDARSPMIAGITMNVINIVLNFFLIYNTRSVYLGAGFSLFLEPDGVLKVQP